MARSALVAVSRLDAMDGDKVVVRLSPPAGRKKAEGKREGVIVRILERAHTRIVGSYEVPEGRKAGIGFVSPSNPRLVHDILITAENAGPAKPGELVSVELLTYPDRKSTRLNSS